jgi:hypothetical protein
MIGSPGRSVPRILRYDAALSARIVARRFRGIDRLLLQDSLNGRLSDMDTRHGLLAGNLCFA